MKNLLIYTGPQKKFSDEDLTLAKIQIDNSLDLGWKREDILLVTDFPFEYNNVKALVIPDGIYYDFDKNANKIPVALFLIKEGLVEPDEVYWCHDFDAYEVNKITDEELGLEEVDLGLIPYFYKPEWQFCSSFFKKGALEVLELVDQTTRAKPHISRNNEKTITKLISRGLIPGSSFKALNVTYAMSKRYLSTIYREATKPLKVVHFRPSDPKDNRMTDSALNMFMYGKNELKIPLMNDRLIKIFKQHGIY